MRWLNWIGHPAVLRAGGVWMVLRQGWLALRLLRDERVPTALKLMMPAALLYAVSPVDVMPDLLPLVGQVDDLGLLVLAVLAFIKLCPADLVAEHQAAMDGRPQPSQARQSAPVDATYRWVDGSSRR
jgi:uncharacterized membrane protein YkvA (DUF1232 family)